MSWRALVPKDVQSRMNSAEDTAARAKFLATGQTDPFEELQEQVTAEFRDAIRSAPGSSVHPDETFLPLSAIGHASVIIRHALLGRFGLTISDGREKEWDAAQRYLRDLASGVRKVTAPADGGEPAPAPVPKPAVNQSPRRDGWRDQDGI